MIIRSTCVKKFKSKFVVFELSKKDKCEQCTFSKFEILSDLFELRFCRIIDLKVIYI
jgi:hypothetical protein